MSDLPLTSAITVTALVQAARNALERAIPLQWVSGEISGFKRASSGHCYFELKDASAQVSCVLYRNRAAMIGVELRDGIHVELRIHPTIYEPRGSLQFTVEQARIAGVGRLYEAFLRLKAKLEAEGLFASEAKRALPSLPHRIGLITSPKAAALADMLRVLRDRWPKAEIVLYPASVQGAAAPGELLAALNAANRRDECDVLVIGRGGGSAEDLWAFNDEALVRRVARSSIPIVSAVGHETDFTLCDFAADVRAPTPTAAAALVVPERQAWLDAVTRLDLARHRAFTRTLDVQSQRLDRAHERLRTSDRALAPWRERVYKIQSRLERALHVMPIARRGSIRALTERYQRVLKLRLAYQGVSQMTARQRELLSVSITRSLQTKRQRVDQLSAALSLLNPEKVLDRGYSVLFTANGKLLSHPSQVNLGDGIVARLKDGEIAATVSAVHPSAE